MSKVLCDLHFADGDPEAEGEGHSASRKGAGAKSSILAAELVCCYAVRPSAREDCGGAS